MTWLLARLGSAAGPYILGAAGLLFIAMGGVIGKQAYTNNSIRAEAAEAAASFAKEHEALAKLAAQAEARAREAEESAARRINEIQGQHQKDIENANAKAAATLADYQRGNLKLRDSLAARACPGGLPQAGTAANGTSQATSGGLQGEDVSFLIRIAAEADAVALTFNECEAVAKSDRQQ